MVLLIDFPCDLSFGNFVANRLDLLIGINFYFISCLLFQEFMALSKIRGLTVPYSATESMQQTVLQCNRKMQASCDIPRFAQ